MSGSKGDSEQSNKVRYRPADLMTQGEVGGILERSFQREGGREPNEEDARRLLALAEEAEKRAEAAESMAREAETAGLESAARASLRESEAGDIRVVDRWKETAETYHREAENLRAEAERLRRYFA